MRLRIFLKIRTVAAFLLNAIKDRLIDAVKGLAIRH